MKSNLSLGYSLNAFPCEDLHSTMTMLRRDAAAIKRAVFPNTLFPIELRLSQSMTDALSSDRRRLARLRATLRDGGFQLLTINGFVPLSFHRGRVKERAYLPRWDDARLGCCSRAAYTNDCISLLAELMDARAPFSSVSVPAGILKRDALAALRSRINDIIATEICRCARHASEIEQRTRRCILIGLEPEPGLTCETTDETIEFFERHLWRILPDELRPYVGVNLDLCHQLVQWEDPLASIRRLLRRNIPLTKIHVTNAIQLDNPLSAAAASERSQLRKFYARSNFLHQTVGVNRSGRRVFDVLDLPQALSPSGLRRLRRARVRKLRVHYHMPLFETPSASINTTLTEVKSFLKGWRGETAKHNELGRVPLIIETYTWPEQLRETADDPRDALRRGVIEELRSALAMLH